MPTSSRKTSGRAPKRAGAITTPGFWDRFVRKTWGRRPAVFKNVLEAPICSPQELFELLRLSADRVRADSKKVFLRFYGDGFNMQVREDFEAVLPTSGDVGFNDYEDRVERALGTREWGFALNNIHTVSPQLWSTGRELMHGLFSRIGMPGGKVSAESFIGPYSSTSFGIHKDHLHVFTFPVLGEKTTLLWPYEALASHLGLKGREEDHLEIVNTPFRSAMPGAEKPIELSAGVGDMTYWPPPYWHIARGHGDMNATVIFAVGERSEALSWATRLAEKPAVQLRLDARKSPGSPARHLAQIKRAAATYSRALRSPELALKLSDELDKNTSAYAFEPAVEPLEGVELQLTDTVEMDARFPIITRRRGDAVDCFINGHVATLTPPKTTTKLMAHLNTGGRFSVQTLCSLASGWLDAEGWASDSKYVLQILSACVSFRALRRAH